MSSQPLPIAAAVSCDTSAVPNRTRGDGQCHHDRHPPLPLCPVGTAAAVSDETRGSSQCHQGCRPLPPLCPAVWLWQFLTGQGAVANVIMAAACHRRRVLRHSHCSS